ncbi:hypothetical protein LINPERPRIM_LOCUS16803 [Linum perenne]
MQAAHNLIPEIKDRLDPEKFQEFRTNLLRLSKASELPENTPAIVEKILDGQIDLIEKFNAFLPEDKYRVRINNTKPSPPPPESVPQACREVVDSVNKLWRRDGKLLNSVVDVLGSYNNEENREDEILRRVVELLKGEPESLQGFVNPVPVIEAKPISVMPHRSEEGEVRVSESAEEGRNPKRAKLEINEHEQVREKILELALKDRNRETITSLYKYSTGQSFDPANLSEEFRILFRSNQAPKENNERKRKGEESAEKGKEAKSCRSKKRITQSYMLVEEEEKKSMEESVLNRSCVLVGRNYSGSGREIKQRKRDPVVEMMNKIEDDRFNMDMMNRMFMSAAEYIEGSSESESERVARMVGKIHVRKCMETMYEDELNEEEVEMVMKNKEMLDKVVKKRVYQKIGELQREKKRLQLIWKEATQLLAL